MNPIRRFFQQESADGILLIIAVALVMINTQALSGMYNGLLQTPVVVQIGGFIIAKPLLLWINDGLMAVFFLVGLELKREFLEGALSEPAQVILPAVGAPAGIAVPAPIYIALNHEDPVRMRGWATPAASAGH